ncbi:hypothetical protein, partial [Streptomyces ossamyceticus]|uniref:hypothetical protein n=1 Tax=Streptomyces ossamyceticus TaxID=249581 RepID=UPI00196A0476
MCIKRQLMQRSARSGVGRDLYLTASRRPPGCCPELVLPYVLPQFGALVTQSVTDASGAVSGFGVDAPACPAGAGSCGGNSAVGLLRWEDVQAVPGSSIVERKDPFMVAFRLSMRRTTHWRAAWIACVSRRNVQRRLSRGPVSDLQKWLTAADSGSA